MALQKQLEHRRARLIRLKDIRLRAMRVEKEKKDEEERKVEEEIKKKKDTSKPLTHHVKVAVKKGIKQAVKGAQNLIAPRKELDEEEEIMAKRLQELNDKQNTLQGIAFMKFTTNDKDAFDLQNISNHLKKKGTINQSQLICFSCLANMFTRILLSSCTSMLKIH